MMPGRFYEKPPPRARGRRSVQSGRLDQRQRIRDLRRVDRRRQLRVDVLLQNQLYVYPPVQTSAFDRRVRGDVAVFAVALRNLLLIYPTRYERGTDGGRSRHGELAVV